MLKMSFICQSHKSTMFLTYSTGFLRKTYNGKWSNALNLCRKKKSMYNFYIFQIRKHFTYSPLLHIAVQWLNGILIELSLTNLHSTVAVFNMWINQWSNDKIALTIHSISLQSWLTFVQLYVSYSGYSRWTVCII